MEEVIICVALCLFMNGELVEHTYQKSMGDCLKAKRIAMRTIEPERIQFKCGNNIKARVEYIEEKGQTQGRIRIVEVLFIFSILIPLHNYRCHIHDPELLQYVYGLEFPLFLLCILLLP